MMEWIYWSISWILLRWHDVWAVLLPGGGKFLGTNWEWVLSIVFLVITVRVLLFPVFVKQIRSQRAMQALQPKMKALQEKHKGDQQTLREEMMKLYQSEKVNPLMGCLPMFLQIPVFLGLFHVLKHINPLHDGGATLYGWTVSEFNSAADAKLFGAPIPMAFKSSGLDVAAVGGETTTVKIVAAILVIIMMFTTFMTSRQMILKTGWSQDPQQKMVQRLMLYGIPVSLLLSGWAFPIGVIIYWVTQNIFSFGQQFWVLHKYPPPLAAGTTAVAARSATTPASATRRATATSGATKPWAARLAEVKKALSNVIAAKAAPSKAGPGKAGPGKAVPGKAVPGRVAPSRVVPSKAVSSKAAPTKAGPAATPPAQTPVVKASPGTVAAEAVPTAPAAQRSASPGSPPSQAPAGTAAAGNGAGGKPPGKAAGGKTPGKAAPAKAAAGNSVPPKGSAGSSSGSTGARRLVSQVSEKSGLFGRKRDDEVAVTPVAEPRSRAPKPGAKPVNPKKGGPKRRTSR